MCDYNFRTVIIKQTDLIDRLGNSFNDKNKGVTEAVFTAITIQ